MASEQYQCTANPITDITGHDKEQLANKNHWDAIRGILEEEIKKEEPTEIKWFNEYGVCDKSCQEMGEDGKFKEPGTSNNEENLRESKTSLTHFWGNTNSVTKNSEYIFAAIHQIKNEIKIENANEDHSECTDNSSTINAELKTQTLKTEDGIDIVYEDIKPEICRKKCGNKSNSNTDYLEHEKVHTGRKQFKCNFCSKTFTLSSTSKYHERTHTGEKPYQCNFCSKRFTRSSYLLQHERTHTGEKPFQCNLCSKSFSQCGSMKIHERTHAGGKPYQCNLCSKSFSQRGAWKLHERTHAGEKQFH